MAGGTDSSNMGDAGEPQDGASFSDEELAAAMADFEREFGESAAADNPVDSMPGTAAATGDAAGTDDVPHIDIPDDASAIDASVGFEDELQGLLGDKAKSAVIVTGVAGADLLAAFCQLSDISASCLGSPQGTVAVLRGLDGDGPEAAARDLTTVVSGLSVILAVNRADKLEVRLYMHGRAADQTIVPPFLFSSAPSFVEDLLLGLATLDDLAQAGIESVDSAEYDRDAAMTVIAKHTKFGRGGSTRGSRVE